MPRLNVVTPNQATGPLKETYDSVTKKMGKVVNIFQGMANSPAALNAYLSMSAALAEGELSPQDRELVYLAVSESNGCNYCVSAHTMIATTQAGLSESDTLAARRFESTDNKRAALLEFVSKVIATKGFVSDEDLVKVRDAGYTDGQIAEAIGYIGLATFSNLFNHVHDTPLDFPPANKLS
ncbi:carboxymuconolactone decarboxylase family protein [Planctomycetes bacterium TBK1r]|uniref:Alkyl hydroperoxide reductase AhpD n=1 Tax=Stieleria magnilauensis TaxID=2527963 RepID=A0ABX5XMJ5_9BACT|nr:Alkyl hydroperoxide reductase AhpD [Planctomycetes bacterium TBK1r]